MIVPVSSEKYKNLFGKASEFLTNAKDEYDLPLFPNVKEITDLNSYYGHMRDFYVAASQHNLKEGYRYIMMPLNGAGEEVFKVDLNLRTITVPPTFLKIGAVQSDQMAELIVFSADRYFDYMDLANTLIYVQWQLPNPDKDGNPIGGATPISIIDLESEPGKMLFAWPLHKNITAQNGVIKFSLRFFLKDATDKNLVYSLNTQSANLTIHAALDVTENLQADDLSLFEFSIINSDYSEAGILPASKPIFEYPGLDLTVVDYDNCFVRYEGQGTQKKSIIAKLDSENKLQLKGQAIINDAGELSYDWRYYPSDENNKCISYEEASDEFPGTVENSYEKASLPINPITKEEYLIGSERYFFKDGEEYKPYHGSTPEEGVDLYECYTVMTIDSDSPKVTGDYSIVAKNTVSKDGAPEKNAETWSAHCILPAPKEIEFKDAVFTLDKENKKIEVNIVEDINRPTYNVKWFKDVESADNAIEKANSVSDDGLVEGMGTVDLTPGWYAARVSANLNKTEKTKGTEQAQVIYATPAIDSISIVGEDGGIDLPLNGETVLEIKVVVPVPAGFEIPEEGEEDNAKGVSLYRNLSYRWEYSIANENKWFSITEKMTGPDKRFDGDVNTNSLLVRHLDQKAYSYRCIVTNTLGNESFTMPAENSPQFVVY